MPGLALAMLWRQARVTLVDAMAKRTRWLEQACRELGIEGRCRVVQRRAEVLGHDPAYRERFEVVTARAFGAPAITAECAAPLVAVGGRLVVSEPPAPDSHRWPEHGLRAVGLGPARRVGNPDVPATVAVMDKLVATPERYPRRVGIPAKRPLW